jgi:hypothetical protein
MARDNTNHCDYFNRVEDIYIETINIIATNYDTNNSKELLDNLLKKYDEGTRRESEDAERHIAFLCWLIYKAFMHVRLIVGLDFLPKEYSMASGTNAPKLVSLQDKKITWTYFRKYPEYFECNIDIEVLWIINFYKELHTYFVKCIKEQIQNKKNTERQMESKMKSYDSYRKMAIEQREWYEDGYKKYLEAQTNINV